MARPLTISPLYVDDVKVAEKATRPSAGKKGLLTDSEAQTAAQLSRELKALLGQPLLPK